MKIKNLETLNNFIYAVNSCKGQVWLETLNGDRFNLKSSFSQYIALGKLLSEHGDSLELFCSDKEDEALFFAFFSANPDSLN